MRKIRLFVDDKNIKISSEIKVSNNDFNYLVRVMRRKVGDGIFVFNGSDGEFLAEITQIQKKFLILQVKSQISDLIKTENITLAFALIKNVGIDFIAQKGTELGVTNFQPLITQNTIVDKVNLDRFRSNVKEACEQCERNDFPQIQQLKKLDKFLEEETKKKILILCDESGQGNKASEILSKIKLDEKDEIVIFIGPEGGFSEEEFAKFRELKNLQAISLGKRILRADTAIISALTLVGEFVSC